MSADYSRNAQSVLFDELRRQGKEEAEQVKQKFLQAKTRSEQEYEETAQTPAARRELTAEEQGELRKLWKKLVSLYHPDRFAHEPDKLATYEKLSESVPVARAASPDNRALAVARSSRQIGRR